jgi:hypothetical protein
LSLLLKKDKILKKRQDYKKGFCNSEYDFAKRLDFTICTDFP